MRHGRLRPRRSAATEFAKLAGVAVTCGVVAAVSVFGYFATESLNAVASNAVDIGIEADSLPAVGLGSVEGGFDLLLVGADNSTDQGDAYGERDSTLNDVNIWLHVSDDHSRAVAMSFPRDLIISHPDCSDPATGESFEAMSAQPLNGAYSRGGLGCVAQTIGALTGVPMDYAALVSFGGVIALSDAVGGVEVCLSDPVEDPAAGLSLPAGTSVLQGQSALAFLRTRHGIGDGSDLARISNQQSFLSSLLRKVKSDATLSDPGKIFALSQVAVDHMTLSTSLANPVTMTSLALAMKGIPLDQIVFVQYPGTTGSDEFPGKVVPISEQADQLIAAIAADQPFTLGADSLGAGVATGETTAPVTPPDEVQASTNVAPSTEAVEPAAPVIDGVKGQDASQATCAQGFSE